ncbi:mevalonate kinase family protein [Blattabacterium cuenoti]|uniref:mevalonate kinase family protein n=1 Tax=Blattabacterium cuenoti TaxID=1653831 RepID=UPI00163C52E4|nr:mevalonate kinase [Blattabacterium cuenoti]
MKKFFFPSKILLFGEYGIIENSSGLSFPYPFYKGALQLNEPNHNLSTTFTTPIKKEFTNSNLELEKYYNFLLLLERKKKDLAKLDLIRLDQDIKKGISFHSNIPQGYGIGSSGALVASIYDKYAKNKLDKKKHVITLKNIFSQMESFFHGKSSGLDPLICYLNHPLLIHSKKNISFIKKNYKKKNFKGKGAIFLIDSGSPRKTSSMVEFFEEKFKCENFKRRLKEEFIKYNETCINAFLKENYHSLLKNVKLLSTWVFHHFRLMIPINFLEIWEKGILTNNYYLKLCGSGGGGFILGFTKNYETLSKLELRKYVKEILFRF